MKNNLTLNQPALNQPNNNLVNFNGEPTMNHYGSRVISTKDASPSQGGTFETNLNRNLNQIATAGCKVTQTHILQGGDLLILFEKV